MTERNRWDYEADDLNKIAETLEELIESLTLVEVVLELAKNKESVKPKQIEYLLQLYFTNDPKNKLEVIANELNELARKLRHLK